MAQLSISDFSGGISSVSTKQGIANSAQFLKAVDIFSDPSYLTLSKATTKISGSTVDGLIYFFVDGSPWNTNRYAYDENGVIYQINSSDTVSKLRTVSGSSGEGMVVHDNALYYAQDTNFGQYYPLDNSPSFDDDFDSWGLESDVQQTGGGTGASDYVPPTSISEAATARQTFTADHDPIESIVIDVDVVGTGDWTVTVHDRANRVVGSKTIVNGSMSTGDVTFTFSSVLRVEPGDDYHFHVTSTVADGGVDTSTATDLEAAEFTINYAPLISATFHPMIKFAGGFAIGNERHIAFFDSFSGEYDPTEIELEAGFEIRTLYISDEYLVAEAWRGQSFSQAEEVRRYYWDGIEQVYNFSEPISQGAPNAARTYRNQIVGVYGNRGSVYAGGKDATKIIDEVPKLAKGKKVEVYPGAITEYEERLLIGYAGSTDDGSSLEQGVYEFGRQTDNLPNVLNFPYVISASATQSTSMKIGAVAGMGTDLYISWLDDDGSTYGIDKVALGDNSTNETAEYRSRWFDNGDTQKIKQAIKLELTFEALVSGDSVALVYEIDRSGSETTGSSVTTVGATETSLFINQQFHEISFGFDFSTSANTFPKITGLNFIYQPLEDEGESA